MDDSKQILKESDPEEALSELEDVYTEKTADPADEPDLSAAEESPLSDDIDQEADPIESDPTAESESVTAMTPPVPEKVSRLNKKTVTLSVILVSVLLSVFALVYFAVSRNAPVRLPEKTEEQQDSEFVSDGDSFSIDDLTDNVIGVGVLFEDAKVFDKADGKEVGKLSGGTTLMIFAADNDYYRVTDMEKTLSLVSDHNEQIAYLRSNVIGLLTHECTQTFLANEEKILNGDFEGSLINHISEKPANAYKHCCKVAYERIYKSRDVVDIEVAGFRIIGTLIDLMTDAVLSPEKAYSQLLINRVSSQYNMRASALFDRIQAVLDYVSGMTDVFALDLYRKLNGNSLPAV